MIAGVDSHKDTHHVVVLDAVTGARLASRGFPATSAGYRQLTDWVAAHGLIDRIGVESTGSYAAGLARHLADAHIDVVEVNRPHPHTRARKGKDDTIDAEAAARKVISGDATARPKTTTGTVEAIRMLSAARKSAVKARSHALVQMQDILITAPANLREKITAKTAQGKTSQCARLRPDTARAAEPAQAAKIALRAIACRIQALSEEIAGLDAHLDGLVSDAAPTLTAKIGIGTRHAAQLLITAGQNIDRIATDAAFARLCGVAPIPVSSGKTHRMRLHRGGDRQANRALHMIAVCRLRYDQRSIDYMTRRRAEGLSKKDVLRCLKRFIARETHQALKTDLAIT